MNELAATNNDTEPTTALGNSASEEMLRIPVVEERIDVATRVVETGRLVLTKVVHEHTETVQVPLTAEQYVVERTPMNEYVTEAPAVRQEGDTTIFPVLKEIVVVEKRLMLVEEIRVTKRQITTSETQDVMLRTEQVTVERIDSERPISS